MTKTGHFQTLIATAHDRGFSPACVVFDSWYSSLKNLKTIRSYQWHWLTQLKSNQQVNLDKNGNQLVYELAISEKGGIVHLKGYGLIKIFKIVSPHSNIEYWTTSNLSGNELFRLKYDELSWAIEEYHQGIKQSTGVEKCMARKAVERNHISLALRAFLRLERYCFSASISWFEAEVSIIRNAVGTYLAQPLYTLTAWFLVLKKIRTSRLKREVGNFPTMPIKKIVFGVC